MASNLFISNVRVPLRDALHEAVVGTKPTRMRPVEADSIHASIRHRANVIGGLYRARVPCTDAEWDALLTTLSGVDADGGTFVWNSGSNMNRRIHVVPNVAVIADLLDADWLRDYHGHAIEYNGKTHYVAIGSLPRSTNVTSAGVLVGSSWNGHPYGDENMSAENEDKTPALHLHYDGTVTAAYEPKSKWAVSNLAADIPTLAYDLCYIEWKRSWSSGGHVYLTLPCVLLGTRFNVNDVHRALAPWRGDDVDAIDEDDENNRTVCDGNVDAMKSSTGATHGNMHSIDVEELAAKLSGVIAEALVNASVVMVKKNGADQE